MANDQDHRKSCLCGDQIKPEVGGPLGLPDRDPRSNHRLRPLPGRIWIWLLALLVAFQVTKYQGSAVMLAGAAGEDRVLSALSSLPAEYTLFNQIPDAR